MVFENKSIFYTLYKTDSILKMSGIDYLKKGDTVAIVAPARKISQEETRPFIHALENAGYKVIVTPHLYGQSNQYSGTDEERIADFQMLLDSSEVKAIFCARGGYGSMRIIDALDFSHFREHPKWICGYSDITVFHAHLNGMGFSSMHAAMPVNVTEENSDSLSMRSLLAVLKGEEVCYNMSYCSLNRPGKVEAPLCGGNLSMLYALQGSPSALHAEGKILFIEDLDEYLYHIDRMMVNLKRSGLLADIAGLLVGGLSDMHDNSIPFGKTAEEIVYEHVAAYNYPVCFGFPAGHADPANNAAIPFGQMASLQVDGDGSQLHVCPLY